MYFKIIACDLDGTLAHNGTVAPETWEALRRARNNGFTLMLVTGRTLDTFSAEGPFAELFEAIISEDGAAVFFTRNNSVHLPFGRLDPEVIQLLDEKNIPLERGAAIVSSWMPHIDAIEEVLHETGRSATIEYNKGAVMVLPPGATKGVGLKFALQELGYSQHNVIACGDAENDRSLFETAEFSVAVANATPEIKALADYILPYPDGKGICHLIDRLCHGQIPPATGQTKNLFSIGKQADGSTVKMQPGSLLGGNWGIVGASASGKSWLAGLLTEGLLQKDYQICIVDPEGDYSALRAFPHTLVLGSKGNALPSAEEVITLSEYTNLSLILDLSAHEVEERSAYVTRVMHALFGLRARRGRPHWFLFDEIHSFCPPEGGPLTDLIANAMKEKGLGIVSYRPSLVAPVILEAIDNWLLTRMQLPEEINLIKTLLSTRKDLSTYTNLLPTLSAGDAFLLQQTPEGAPPTDHAIKFRVARRAVPHVRHLNKYLRAPLPAAKRFYFDSKGKRRGPKTAASLWEFQQAMQTVPVSSLKYHLQNEDFERWSRDVFHDKELERRLRKLRRRNIDKKHLRDELSRVVSRHYEELESLI